MSDAQFAIFCVAVIVCSYVLMIVGAIQQARGITLSYLIERLLVALRRVLDGVK